MLLPHGSKRSDKRLTEDQDILFYHYNAGIAITFIIYEVHGMISAILRPLDMAAAGMAAEMNMIKMRK